MEDNINKKIKEGFRGLNQLTPSDTFFNFDDESIKISNVYNEIISNTELIKCLLVLGLKKFTWRNELEIIYGINNYYVSKFIDLFKKNGLIINKLLCEIEEIYFEAIIKSNSIKLYEQRDTINIISLNEKGYIFVEKCIDKIIKLAEIREDIFFIVNEINNKLENFNLLIKNILLEETTLTERLIQYPNGLIQNKRTLYGKKIDKDTKEALLELKKQNNKISTSEEKELMLIKDNKYDLVLLNNLKKEKKNRITYNGIYSNLTINEIFNKMSISKEEEKEFIKNEKKEIKERLDKFSKLNKDYEEQYKNLKFNGYHNEDDFKKDKNNKSNIDLLFDNLNIENE